MHAIRSAISSIGLEQFHDQVWEKSVAFVPSTGKLSQELKDIYDWISEFLDRTDIRYPSIRVVKDGKEIPLEDYAKELRIGPHLSHDWINNELIFYHYQQGATIVLQRLENSLPLLGKTVNEMASYFSANLHVSCFITPPNSQGFTPHYDTYSFFAVQLFGEKKWNLYDATELPPIRVDRELEMPWVSVPPEREITIREGDVMYIPRGRYHSAFTSSSASIHLTVGLYPPNWLDVTKSSIDELQLMPKFRESVNDCCNQKDMEQHVVEIEQLLHSQLDLRAGMKKFRAQVFSRSIDSRKGRLQDLLLLSTNNQILNYELQPIPHRLAMRDDHAVLQFANKELRFPKSAYPALTAICEKRTLFQLQELPRILDDKSYHVLLRKLVGEGFLHIPTNNYKLS